MLEKQGYNFCLGKFEEIVSFLDQNGPDVDIDTKSSPNDSRSNETIKNITLRGAYTLPYIT